MPKIDTPEQAFGKTKLIKATGGNTVETERIKAPFSGEQYCIHHFCQGCGTYSQLEEKTAEEIAERIGVSLPANKGAVYFKSAGCEACDGNREDITLERV